MYHSAEHLLNVTSFCLTFFILPLLFCVVNKEMFLKIDFDFHVTWQPWIVSMGRWYYFGFELVMRPS
jgi:hypothetical protein